MHSWFTVGNFYRIRSAFKYGARKLGWILLLPEERMEAELNKFFANTLDRHCWSNAEFPTMDAGFGVSVQTSAPLETCVLDKLCLEPTLDLRDEKTSGAEVSFSNISFTGSGCEFTGNVQKLGMPVLNTSSTNDAPKLSSLHSNQINLVSENCFCAPQNGFRSLLGSRMTSDCVNSDEICLMLEVESKDEGFNKRCNGDTRSFEDAGKLLDLCGDYDSYFRNLRYSQICDRYAMSPTLPLSPPMSPHRQKNYPWRTNHRSLNHNHNIPSGIDRNGFTMGLQSNPVNHFAIVLEENKRPQGIGTYFPRTVLYETFYLLFITNLLC